jgi:hypothetical protein
MTIPSSSAPAARRYLFDQLTSVLTPDPLSPHSSLIVVYDEPTTDEPDDIVAVGRVNRTLSAAAFVGNGGGGWLDESYSVEIQVDVFRGGDDAQAAYERAALLSDAVIAAVRADPSLGGVVSKAQPTLHETETSWDSQHMGRQATSTISIQCVNRI